MIINSAFLALLDRLNIDYTAGNGTIVVHGDLDLSNAYYITTLPDNLSVIGHLYLQHTNIIRLPNNLRVGGYLDLRGTGITVIPHGVHVGLKILMNASRAGTDGGQHEQKFTTPLTQG